MDLQVHHATDISAVLKLKAFTEQTLQNGLWSEAKSLWNLHICKILRKGEEKKIKMRELNKKIKAFRSKVYKYKVQCFLSSLNKNIPLKTGKYWTEK